MLRDELSNWTACVKATVQGEASVLFTLDTSPKVRYRALRP